MVIATSPQSRQSMNNMPAWCPLPLNPHIAPTHKISQGDQKNSSYANEPLNLTPPNEIELPDAFNPLFESASTNNMTNFNPTRPLFGRTISNGYHTPPERTESSVEISAPETISKHDPASTRLRHMIKNSPSIIACPGVYDGLTARIALSVGFPGLYMTGAGTTASRLGAPDLGIAQLHDMRTNAEMIANLTPHGPPLIADMDTGYGGPIVVARAVQLYHQAGVAGFHIEDQIMQKRCGHLAGKEVVDLDTYVQRIRACKVSADRLSSDIVIIARTDALQSRGYEECIARLRCARDAGADMGILEGVESKAQAAQAVRDMAPWPLCLNSVENGVSPLITVQEAQEMGYRVIIFSFAAIAPAYTAVRETMERLKRTGCTGSRVAPKTVFEVCGLAEAVEIDEAAGGTAFVKGV